MELVLKPLTPDPKEKKEDHSAHEKKPEEQWQHEHHLDDFGALLGFA